MKYIDEQTPCFILRHWK